MKKVTIKGKLNLKKETVSKLNSTEMNAINGLGRRKTRRNCVSFGGDSFNTPC